MNSMLMKKLFNIAAISNEMMSVEVVKLHSESATAIERVLYAAECS